MAQPLVKYTLNRKGQVPSWIDTGSDSFAGQHGISGNKDGCIPRYESPQDTIWIGLATGDVDSDGTPDPYIGSITTKTALTTYLKTVGNTIKYKTVTSTVTGIQTATTVGLSTTMTTFVTPDVDIVATVPTPETVCLEVVEVDNPPE